MFRRLSSISGVGQECPTYRRHRPALMLVELLIALSVMVMIIATLGGLARAVQSGAEYSEGHATATQHARVVLDRILRTVDEAFANERFPGFFVAAEQRGEWRFPDTLVVWYPEPEVAAAHPERPPLDDPDRLPYHDELVVYCPDPEQPNRLVEIRSTRDVTLSGDPDLWVSQIQVFKEAMSLDTDFLSDAFGTAPAYRAVTLTELMRAAPVADSTDAPRRAAVRFEAHLRPSDEAWNDSSISWEALPWVQGTFSSQTGLRQAWLRMELQLMPGETALVNDRSQQAVPFFGSAAVYYPMYRERRP